LTVINEFKSKATLYHKISPPPSRSESSRRVAPTLQKSPESIRDLAKGGFVVSSAERLGGIF